jgi:cytochrome c553
MLLGIFLLFAYAAKVYLTDDSYYRFGYYRADAVPELTEGDPLYLGSPYCLDQCHQERAADWRNGAHQPVQCEVCHGPDPAHPDDKITLIPADPIRLCSACHEAMPSRPAGQPQIVLGAHPFADGEIMPCIECHDPHAPGPVVREEKTDAVDSRTAAPPETAAPAPPGASKCAKCHGKQGEGVKKSPALAGLESAYFTDKMQMYRSGAGDSKVMTRFAKALSDGEIAEMAEYYESLAATQPGPSKE